MYIYRHLQMVVFSHPECLPVTRLLWPWIERSNLGRQPRSGVVGVRIRPREMRMCQREIARRVVKTLQGRLRAGTVRTLRRRLRVVLWAWERVWRKTVGVKERAGWFVGVPWVERVAGQGDGILYK